MNDSFEKKPRAAAVAGWWVLLIAYALLTITLFIYLTLLSAQQAWLLTMWGLGDLGWDFVQTMSLWFMGVFKLCLWLMFVVVLWLTLWAGQLRKMERHATK
jgi:hypothetical protein